MSIYLPEPIVTSLQSALHYTTKARAQKYRRTGYGLLGVSNGSGVKSVGSPDVGGIMIGGVALGGRGGGVVAVGGTKIVGVAETKRVGAMSVGGAKVGATTVGINWVGAKSVTAPTVIGSGVMLGWPGTVGNAVFVGVVLAVSWMPLRGAVPHRRIPAQ